MTKLQLLLVSMALCCVQLNATIHYVTSAGAGTMDASSWANAAPGTQLQAVINSAVNGDSVWVACGTYYPTTTTDRSLSFSMREGISIFGSFQGTETFLYQRNINITGLCTILSGEIGAAGIADNSYTVVYNQDLTNAAILDGFIIRDGNDDRSPTSFGDGLGGGLYNHGFGASGFCHPVVRNCQFINNRASWGGGAFNNGYNSGNAQPIYINCVFTENHAYIEAGGMDSYGVGGNASPTLYNCIFYKNTSATNVGAMYCWGGNSGGNCHPTLINCAFINNRALNGYGGAFIADNLDENLTTSSGSCSVTLQNCILWGNTATGVGQQFYIRGTGAQVLATYSDIDTSGQPAPHIVTGSGTGNISVYPMLNDTANGAGPDLLWFTLDDGLQNYPSPCNDAGNNTGVYATDILGFPRIYAGVADIGPYEAIYGGINEESPVDAIIAYPNPTNDMVKIDFKNEVLSGVLKVYSIDGKLHFTKTFIDASLLNLSLPEPKGIYLIQIVTEEQFSKSLRVIKQ